MLLSYTRCDVITMSKEKENPKKMVHVQGIMLQGDLDKLKEKTGEENTKDAITIAIEAYLK